MNVTTRPATPALADLSARLATATRFATTTGGTTTTTSHFTGFTNGHSVCWTLRIHTFVFSRNAQEINPGGIVDAAAKAVDIDKSSNNSCLPDMSRNGQVARATDVTVGKRRHAHTIGCDCMSTQSGLAVNAFSVLVFLALGLHFLFFYFAPK